VLDSGGYGAVTIAQSVSIVAPRGVYAGISVFGGDGITIAAGAGGKVTLRGLTINGQGGNRGIVVTSAAEVHVEQCIVTGMTADGIRIDGGTSVTIRNSSVRSNGVHGLDIVAAATKVRVVDSQFSNNVNDGIIVVAGTVDAERIIADHNGDNGLRVDAVAAGTVTVTVSDSAFTWNGNTGAIARPDVAGATARLAIARSTSAHNAGGGFGVNTFNLGAALLTIWDSAMVENVGKGVITNGTNAIGVVGGSVLAGNIQFDFDQRGSSVLRTAGTNMVTGRGAPDINGTLTANPLK